MKNIKEKLRFLRDYYAVNRGVGHSNMMVNGSELTPKGIIVAADMQSGRNLAVTADRAVSIHSLNNLRGRTNPIAIDNAALYILFDASLKRIEELEQEVVRLKSK
jgi:hypothetical protein